MKRAFVLIMLSLFVAACGGSGNGFRLGNMPAPGDEVSAPIPDFDFTNVGPYPDMSVPYPTDEPIVEATTTTTTSTSTTTTLPGDIIVIAPPNPKKEKPVEQEFDPASVVPSATKEDFVGFNTLSPTIYYKAIIDEEMARHSCQPEQMMSIMKKNTTTKETSEILKLCPKAFNKCKLEGSCVVAQGDQKIPLNYHYYDEADQRSYFVVTDVKRCPFGYGVRNSCLDPYYTVAADLNIYKPGDVIYVPALVGVEMGQGQKHHGFFIIRDQGKGIKGRGRFDFFTGYHTHVSSKNLFKKFKLGDVNTELKYYLIKNPSKLNKFIKESRNYPNLPVKSAN